MQKSFTGSSRRPRQVNLSGRQTTNPFAPAASASPAHDAIASAQRNREARQLERTRIQAAALLQRRWRGHASRKQIRHLQRQRWDQVEAQAAPLEYEQEVDDGRAMDLDTPHQLEDVLGTSDELDGERLPPYSSSEVLTSQLLALLHFLDSRDRVDLARLRRLYLRLKQTSLSDAPFRPHIPPRAVAELRTRCIDTFSDPKRQSSDRILTQNIARYLFGVAGWQNLTDIAAYLNAVIELDISLPIETSRLAEPLENASKLAAAGLQLDASNIYDAFVSQVLTVPELQSRVGGVQALSTLAGAIDRDMLAKSALTIDKTVKDTKYGLHGRTALLGHFIYFYNAAASSHSNTTNTPDITFVEATSSLLSSILSRQSIATGRTGSEDSRSDLQDSLSILPRSRPFISEQISTLVNQKSISTLLVHLLLPKAQDKPHNGSLPRASAILEHDSRKVASYILTLLRAFPRKANEIRMWLYMGSSNIAQPDRASDAPDSAVRYFYLAAQATGVYNSISADPREAIPLLRARDSGHSNDALEQAFVDDDWCIILIFIELYLFALTIMDDEEFFARSGNDKTASAKYFGNPNALFLAEVQKLVTFLKNLGFTMYYWAPEISGTTNEEAQQDLKSLFGGPNGASSRVEASRSETKRNENQTQIGGLRGTSLDHLKKDLVVPLLRAIYERDSRRKFLPDGHWLMTSRFDMTKFIDAVVEEEERRNKLQEDDDEDSSDDDEMEDRMDTSPHLVGTAREQHARRIHQLQREQRKASRKRYLQTVAPRLEILQNMPFLIPFKTRVQIFRRFVYLDQYKRRNGAVDPEIWRMSQRSHMNHDRDSLQRHYAKIRRGHEFEDAYHQFFGLGADLKEPIQITFVDQFDTEEMGIDGGGVTKEFLTSTTNQAFAPRDGIQLFSENEDHFLYPNPSAIEAQRQLLLDVGFREFMPTFKATMDDLLQQYEFLGRIMGKCLYEGILIDVSFAGFFLLKWSLTSSKGSGQRGSGYTANINDLREYDEGLYQGLIQLKNYPGDVEDFALNFTITDTISAGGPDANTRTVTRELIPNGASIAVTNANRPLYLSYVVRHRLQNQPAQQTNAFLRGLSSMIQPSWLSMFNQQELQTLVGGAAAQISVADLRRSTEYGGVYQIGDDGEEHPSVKLFWDVMQHDFTEEERRKVLKFVTSTPRAPLLGFASLNPRFSIRDAGNDETRLPSTSTCVNLLKLPRYTNRETCRRKLLQAVSAGAGFDLS